MIAFVLSKHAVSLAVKQSGAHGVVIRRWSRLVLFLQLLGGGVSSWVLSRCYVRLLGAIGQSCTADCPGQEIVRVGEDHRGVLL